MEKDVLFSELGHYHEAVSALDRSIHLNPARFDTNTHKGKLLTSSGKYRGAVTESDNIIERNPSYADAWWLKAVTLENRGDSSGSGSAKTRAVSLDPKNIDQNRSRASPCPGDYCKTFYPDGLAGIIN